MPGTNLSNNQKKARQLLASLRADRSLSYKKVLQEVLILLGSDYKVPSSEIAKGLLTAIIYDSFDYVNNRNIMLVAFCLSWEYNKVSATARRKAYLDDFSIEFYGAEVTEGNVRKSEENNRTLEKY